MYKYLIKPIGDRLIALISMIFLIPIIIVVGILIKLEDGGKVFYRAKRLGENGKHFYMYKFRSMKENAPDIRNEDGTTFSSADDPRLTKIGKFLRESSIDELPQLINVLFGQMSLLGPRPDPVEWYQKLNVETRKKYDVKPGISGYVQAYYRNTLSLEEKNQREVHYAEHISFWFDVKIFFKTIYRVLQREAVYREEAVYKSESFVKKQKE